MNCLCGFLIYAFYTGVLTSLMTATPVSININSFQVSETEYFAVKKNISIYIIFSRIFWTRTISLWC